MTKMFDSDSESPGPTVSESELSTTSTFFRFALLEYWSKDTVVDQNMTKRSTIWKLPSFSAKSKRTKPGLRYATGLKQDSNQTKRSALAVIWYEFESAVAARKTAETRHLHRNQQ